MAQSSGNELTVSIGMDLKQVAEDAKQLGTVLQSVSTNINTFASGMDKNLETLTDTMSKVNTSVSTLANSGLAELSRTFNQIDFKTVSEGLKSVVESFDQMTEKINKGKGKSGGGGSGGSSSLEKTAKDIDNIDIKIKTITKDLATGREVLRGLDEQGNSVVKVFQQIEGRRSGQLVGSTVTEAGELTKYAQALKDANNNLRQQISLRKTLTTYEIKSQKTSGQTQELYTKLTGSIQQRLPLLHEELNTILATNPEILNESSFQALMHSYVDQTTKSMADLKAATAEENTQVFSLEQAFENVAIKLTRMATQAVVQKLSQAMREAVDYMVEFYDSLNEIRVVTGKTQQEADALGDSFRNMARDMGVSSKDIIASGITYYRQGLDDNEVQDRIKSTIEYSKAAAISAETASEYITAATNSMGVSAEHVADVYLTLGDSAATSGIFGAALWSNPL